MNSSDINQLKLNVAKTFGKKVITKTNCQELRLSIYSNTGKWIGITTLRRFFELIENKSKFSNSILNVLCQYCGVGNWENFKSRSNEEKEYHHIYMLISNHYLLIEYLEYYSKDASIQSIDFFEKAILHFSNNKEKLKSILFVFFNSKPIWRSLFLYQFRFKIVQIIAEIVYSKSYFLEIIKVLLETTYGKEFFHLHPRIDLINSKFSKALEYYIPESNNEIIFKESALLYKDFKALDRERFAKRFKTLNEPNSDSHSLIISRWFSCNIMSAVISGSNLDIELQKIRMTLKGMDFREDKYSLNAQFIVVYPFQILLIAGKIKEILSFYKNSILKQSLVSDYWIHNVNNFLKIYYALFLQSENKKSEAKVVFNSIKVDLFPLFEKQLQLKCYKIANDMLEM